MAISETTRVWEQSQQEGTALLILLAIADSANEYGHAWPGRERLAKYARCEVATVSRLIAKIEGDCELYTIRLKGRGNHYAVLAGLSDAEKDKRRKHLSQSVRTSDNKSLPQKQGSDHHDPTPVQSRVQKNSRSVKNHTTAEKRSKKTAPTPRRRDLLFDAFVQVCRLESATAGSFVGKYKKLISEAGYTAEDVLRFGEIWATREYPGGAMDGKAPSPASVAKYIQWVRETPVKQADSGVVVDYNEAILEALRNG
jgi:hypothetical protein